MNTTLAEVFPAGEHLSDELEARGWTQVEFAEILGRPTQFVSEIIQGKKEITRESAAQIAAALGTSAEFWLNLQDSYFLWQQRQDPQAREELNEVATRAKLNDLAPMAALRKRGVITATTTAEQAKQLRHLMGTSNLDDQPARRFAARRSNGEEALTPTQNAWFACVRRIAETLPVKHYSRASLDDVAARTSRLVREPEGFLDLPDEYAAAGVRLVFFEAFPSSKISGASYQDEHGPVIALSGRGQRLDKVLFTLLHEAAHIVRGDTESGEPVIDEDDHTLGDEDRANEVAANWVLPEALPSNPSRITKEWVEEAADLVGVHPIVVVGRLQRDEVIPWRTALVKDAPTATQYLRMWPGELQLS
ncbi:HigA family addiction module antitoxin [Occultella gossypii]|uniref:HigA family addiction module antidote protein n=1 Tax=Occultella gossypii TaxID=2800820 RepID=A0ABS7SDP6_9MICO|nr:HigA family addiction module antitoxin [Occultella gossypii]MBZ2198467.1 HigA family addiction module antidote protein [Occultella gossypii]